jgi:hypothetical protein
MLSSQISTECSSEENANLERTWSTKNGLLAVSEDAAHKFVKRWRDFIAQDRYNRSGRILTRWGIMLFPGQMNWEGAWRKMITLKSEMDAGRLGSKMESRRINVYLWCSCLSRYSFYTCIPKCPHFLDFEQLQLSLYRI